MENMTALVTGANRGIGLEVCKQLGRRGIDAGRRVGGIGSRLRSTARTAGKARRCPGEQRGRVSRRGPVDVPQPDDHRYDGGELLRAVWTSRTWMPGMNRRGYGRIVNVTSGYGSFAEGLEGSAAYAISKAALNALTVRLAREAHGDVKVNAGCPGWVRTRMGGSGAPKSVEEGADTIVWLATLSADGPSGGLFRNRRPVPW